MTAAIAPNDVLCGRGGATNNHPGNKKFRSIVAEHMDEYLQARKKEKATIAKRIVTQIKEAGGRFLKRDQDTDVWVEVPERRAREKTSQALREGLDVRHKTYRPEKMARRDSDASSENPRKKTRLVEGKVADNDSIHQSPGNSPVPELKNETPSPRSVDPLFLCFEPPVISQPISPIDCEDVAAV
eukprot:Nitzschia sp. Nitz4//scaffold141_size107518//87781//88335//NITZ4_004295-RA/size107518-processed-gene-0.92-mRNA-1//1//CDS//3329536345//3672//frame0